MSQNLWWYVNMVSGNGLVPAGNKPLPKPLLTYFYDDLMCFQGLMCYLLLCQSCIHTVGIINIASADTLLSVSKEQWVVLPWLLLLGLLCGCPIFKSSHRNTFEYLDFNYRYQITKWVAVTWQEWEGTRIVVPSMTTRWHNLFCHYQYFVTYHILPIRSTGCFC